MAKAGARDKITLACTDCKQRNYNSMKNKKNDPDRLEMKNIAGSAASTRFIARLNKRLHAGQDVLIMADSKTNKPAKKRQARAEVTASQPISSAWARVLALFLPA